MNSRTLSSTLGALRSAGSVFGVIFSKGSRDIFAEVDLDRSKKQAVASVVDDIIRYFEEEKRAPEVLSFCYDGGNILLVLSGAYRFIVLYHRADEVDFISEAVSVFMRDYFAGRAVEDWKREARIQSVKGKATGAETPNKLPAPKRSAETVAAVPK